MRATTGVGTAGNVRWYFTETETVNSSATFGNDLVISSIGILGNVTVSLVDQIFSLAPASVARYYTINPVNDGSVDLRVYYGDSELQGELESNLKIWRWRSGSWTRLGGLVNPVLNYVELTGSGYNLLAGILDILVLSDAEEDHTLPVELSVFTAFPGNGQVILEWATESEVENAYWIIDRKEVTAEEYEQISEGTMLIEESSLPFQPLAQVPGQGSINTRTDYQYIDEFAEIGPIYAYRLTDVSYTGVQTSHPVSWVVPDQLPQDYELSQNYPNPFNPQTHIKYTLPVTSRVILRIFTILGQEVVTLVDAEQPAGYQELIWDGTNRSRQPVASGTYIYQISAQSLDGKKMFTRSKRMTLLR